MKVVLSSGVLGPLLMAALLHFYGSEAAKFIVWSLVGK